MWFFLPRKLCRDAYNIDSATFTTLIMAVAESDDATAWEDWVTNDDGDGVLVQQAPLGGFPLRGVSDFNFIPGTGDCHIFVLRTEVTYGIASRHRRRHATTPSSLPSGVQTCMRSSDCI